MKWKDRIFCLFTKKNENENKNYKKETNLQKKILPIQIIMYKIIIRTNIVMIEYLIFKL